MKLTGTQAAKEAFQRTFGSIIREFGIELTDQCPSCAAKGGCGSPRIDVTEVLEVGITQVIEDPSVVYNGEVCTVRLMQDERLTNAQREAMEATLRDFLRQHASAAPSRH